MVAFGFDHQFGVLPMRTVDIGHAAKSFGHLDFMGGAWLDQNILRPEANDQIGNMRRGRQGITSVLIAGAITPPSAA